MNISLINIQEITIIATSITDNNNNRQNNNNNGIRVLQWRRPNHAQLRANFENQPQFASRWDNQLRNF